MIWRGPMRPRPWSEFLKATWSGGSWTISSSTCRPGTGDVQLSLCQKLALTGAVVVSTPQDVALKVAQKAITLFEMLKTPVLGLVENIDYYACPHCGERDDIFGSGGTRRAAEALGLPFLGELPLATEIRERGDSGRPSALDADSPHGRAFRAVAELAAQISIRSLRGELGGAVKLSF